MINNLEIEKIFIISDTHFAHKNILEYENRPFRDLVDMRAQMILRWNSKVGPNDLVIHLGDFGFCDKKTAAEILSRLNGHKILIKGNHDQHGVQWFLDAGFEEVHNYLCAWFRCIDKYVLFTHQPYKVPEECKDAYDYHMYGHVHEKGNEPGLYPTVALNGACMCVERWDYYPMKLTEVVEMCKNAATHFNEQVQNAVESDKQSKKIKIIV